MKKTLISLLILTTTPAFAAFDRVMCRTANAAPKLAAHYNSSESTSIRAKSELNSVIKKYNLKASAPSVTIVYNPIFKRMESTICVSVTEPASED
ncbi:MAG: hypothetical protein HOO06_05770 [Bdellovibrionaceae bacterium]|nr:hypothetical protein [Pseudobdellovibrionaceae bacterium]